ncbi:MAG: hypothetical protein U5K74_01190 [Gemmatimonadaceae bacterium]|nr:hypothetical protein [Gemmatimonadaceae bacterium]
MTGLRVTATVPPTTGVTVSVSEVVASDTPVPRARTVIVDAEPVAAVPDAASDRLLLVAPALSVAGVKVAVTPVGSPSAVSATSPEKLTRPTVIAAVPAALCATESVGDAVETEMLAVVTGGCVVDFFPLHAVHTSTGGEDEARESAMHR